MRGTSPSARSPRAIQMLRAFAAWCADRGVTRSSEVTRPILERYQRWLFHYRKADGRPLTFHTQQIRLVSIRAFFKHLARQNRILSNPASDLDLPRRERRLPRESLTPQEAERVLAQPDVTKPLGLRDRAILETFYSTGMRTHGAREPRSLRPRRRARDAHRSARGRERKTVWSRSGSARSPGSRSTARRRAPSS